MSAAETILSPEAVTGAHGSSLQRFVSRQWQNVTMINADCLDIGHCVGEVQVVITDPPYGMGAYKLDDDASVITKLEPWHRKAVFGYPETLVRWCLKLGVPDEWVTWWPTNKFGGNYSKLPRTSEAIAIFGELCERPKRKRTADASCLEKHKQKYGYELKEEAGLADVWRDPAPGIAFNAHQRLHPNEKPVSVMERLVRLCSWEGETVLDPYAGSGTTAIACIRTGRKFIGIEKDPKHYQTACERIDREMAQGVLLPANVGISDPAQKTP